jgi:hypothetical protein
MSFGCGRALRAVLFASVLLAVWAFALPARAAWAPLCDDRGASVLAPPPALEAPDEAITRTASAACDRDATSRLTALSADHGKGVSRSAGCDAAVPVTATRPPARCDNGPWHGSPRATERPPASIRSRVERPPRI